MTFRISDKVVCVDDSPGRGRNCMTGKPSGLKKGMIYTVRGLGVCSGTGRTIVYVTGINLPVGLDGKEIGYWPNRFRLLSDIQAENAAKREELIPCGKEARRE